MGTFLIIVIIILAVLVSLNGTGKLENIKSQLSNYQKNRVKNSSTGYQRIFDLDDCLNADPIPRSVFIPRVVILFVLLILPWALEGILNDLPTLLEYIGAALFLIFFLFILLLWILNVVKRAKDIGWSPWLMIVPVANVVFLGALLLSESKKGESVYRSKDGETVFVADENKNINDSEEAVYKAPVSTDRKKELEDQIKQQEEEIEIEELEKKLEELKNKRKK